MELHPSHKRSTESTMKYTVNQQKLSCKHWLGEGKEKNIAE